jgi:hypothetical protein
MVMKQFDRIACLPGRVGRPWQAIPDSVYFWALIVQELFCEATGFGLVLDRHLLLWISIQGQKRNHHPFM